MKIPSILAAMLMTAAAEPAWSDAQQPAHAQGQIVTPASALRLQPAPAEHFIGKAEFARLPLIPDSPDQAAIVHFEAGALTHWHTHSQGQYLIVVRGEGRTQQWGGPVQILREGDVVWCPPGVKHWHGGGEHTAMSHIAISPKAADNRPEWLERVDLASVQGRHALAASASQGPQASEAASTPQGADADRHRQTAPLTARQLAIVPIAALSATGDLKRLPAAIEAGLDRGLSVGEIREIFAHQYAYAGFPRALNGIITLQGVTKARAARGIQDAPGKEPTPLQNPDYYQLGTQTLQTLGSARAANGVLFDFPGIDYALKAHLFGYLFHRDNLSYVDRQLVTVSTLAALRNVNPQLKSHLQNTQNLGVDKAQLARVFAVLAEQVDAGVADNAQRVLANESTEKNTMQTEILSLSQRLWQALLAADTETAATMIDEQAVFVHMGATLDKAQELDAIRQQLIRLKTRELKESSVRIIGSTAVVLNRIQLTAVVNGQEVSNPFVVTETYTQQGQTWRLAAMSYTRIIY